jgi:hypothetical protein
MDIEKFSAIIKPKMIEVFFEKKKSPKNTKKMKGA